MPGPTGQVRRLADGVKKKGQRDADFTVAFPGRLGTVADYAEYVALTLNIPRAMYRAAHVVAAGISGALNPKQPTDWYAAVAEDADEAEGLKETAETNAKIEAAWAARGHHG